MYETPGGTILYRAHEVLEMITLDKDTKHMKQKLAIDFADLLYNGKWFTPLREALQRFRRGHPEARHRHGEAQAL